MRTSASRVVPVLKLALVHVLMILIAAGVVSAQDPPEDYDVGLFEVRAAHLERGMVPALLSPRGSVLLPALAILEYLGIPVDHASADSIVARVAPGVVSRLRITQRILQVDTITYEIDAGDLLAALDNVFLRADHMGQFFQGEAEVSFADLAIFLAREALDFPAQLELERARRRAPLLGATAREPRLAPEPFRTTTGGAVLDWSVSGRNLTPHREYSALFHGGFALFGGAVTVGGSVQDLEGRPDFRYERFTYDLYLPERPWLRRLQLGDVTTPGVVARAIRGGVLSNAPVRRSEMFDEISVDPHVPPGWQYEIYRDGQLVGFSDGLVEEIEPIPFRYGQTPIEVRLYGPAGEQETRVQLFQVATSQIPEGHTEYAVGFGACRSAACRTLGSAELRRGLSPFVTVGAGIERHEFEDEVSWRPFASAALAGTAGWQAEVAGVSGQLFRAVVNHRAPGGRASHLRVQVGQPGFARPSYLPQQRTRWEVSPATAVGRIRVRGTIGGELAGPVDNVSVAGSVWMHRHFFEPSYFWDTRGTSGGAVGLRAMHPVGRLPGTPTVNWSVTADADGARTIEAGFGLRVLGLSPQVRGQWSRAASSSVTLSLHREFATTRFWGMVRGRRGETTHAAYTFSGALGLHPEAGVDAFVRGGVEHAGVGGRVFYDQDGDGTISEGDIPVEGARVLVGGIPVETDADGRYVTWQVIPFEPVPVRIDTLTQIDPVWTPTRHLVVLQPTPHTLNRVDFLLVQTRELGGQVVAGPGIPTVAGVTLEMTSLETGQTQTFQTFSDGSFYVSRVRPGRYTLRTSDAARRALSARAEPDELEFTIDTAEAGYFVELPPIRLVRSDS